MTANNIILMYKGVVSRSLIDSLLQLTESKLERIEGVKRVRKRVFSVLVECLQNVYIHSPQQVKYEEETQQANTTPHYSALLVLGRDANGYFIITGNPVDREKANWLRDHIDKLNSMSREELDNFYLEMMREGGWDEKGAGLGLIEIIRKSQTPIEYSIESANGDFYFFTLKVVVPAGDFDEKPDK